MTMERLNFNSACAIHSETLCGIEATANHGYHRKKSLQEESFAVITGTANDVNNNNSAITALNSVKSANPLPVTLCCVFVSFPEYK